MSSRTKTLFNALNEPGVVSSIYNHGVIFNSHSYIQEGLTRHAVPVPGGLNDSADWYARGSNFFHQLAKNNKNNVGQFDRTLNTIPHSTQHATARYAQDPPQNYQGVDSDTYYKFKKKRGEPWDGYTPKNFNSKPRAYLSSPPPPHTDQPKKKRLGGFRQFASSSGLRR